MTAKYYFENASKPQQVSIEWEMLTSPDEFADAPDQNSDGFWPSRDPDAAGYVSPDRFDAEQAKAEARMSGWKRGDWQYIGVQARATIMVPIGSNSFSTHTLTSGGLWGIESDCGDYIAEVFEDEKAQLLTELATLGAFAATQIKGA